MSARISKFVLSLCCCALIAFSSNQLHAQNNNGGGNNGGGNNGGGGTTITTNNGNQGVVGGVSIDARGVLLGEKEVISEQLRRELREGLQVANPNLSKQAKLRMISLRGLEAAIMKAREEGRPLSNDVSFMAGLQRIEFVVMSPETNDIIIGGPAEGWKVNNDGQVVGETSGTPVIRLEDFLVAMRSVDNARSGQGISVSIDPTEQGVKALQQLYKNFARQNVSFGPNLSPEVEKALGPQKISLSGVPEDSRFSRVLVAADYKMKRLSMGLEQSPIAGLPSFMEMAAAKKVRSMKAAPRFWMECNYEPVAKSEDGNVWQIRGKGVKTLTQETHFAKDGSQQTTDKQNRFAAKWADLMTEKFEELSAAEPAFRELRNIMDLSVIAAILKQENMTSKVGLEMPAILGTANIVNPPAYSVPKSVPTECSFVRLDRSWLVSASGGVQLNSWGVASNSETVTGLASISAAAKATNDQWWWNAK